MQTAIITSKEDPAGMNIAECLKRHNLGSNAAVHEIDEDSIHCENIDKKINADLFIFATRHQSKSGTASLSCHSPGNWGIAEAGGMAKKLCIAPAVLLKEAFLGLNKHGAALHHEITQTRRSEPKTPHFSAGIGSSHLIDEFVELKTVGLKSEVLDQQFSITLECTHHGPYVEKPAMFIEIGSNEAGWKSREAGKAVAAVVAELANNIGNISSKAYEVGFGIGGTHYCSSFNKVMQRTNIALGHICPKHMLDKLDKELILQAMKKTIPGAKFAVLDWKGLGKEKASVIRMLDELRIVYKRADQLLKQP